MQKGYLARVLSAAEGRCATRASSRSRSSWTARATASRRPSSSTPTRRSARSSTCAGAASLREAVLPPHPLRRYDALAYREALDDLLRPLLRG